MPTGFEVVDSDLRSLDAEDSVLFFRELLWAEAAETGVTQSDAHTPTKINVGDGGLDATFSEAQPDRDDIIPEGNSGFQIKSSDMSYSRWENEVSDSDGDGLKPRIERLLSEGGTYVLVIFDELVGMPSDRDDMDKLERWEHTLREKFAEFDDADVRVYDTSKLSGFVNRFPALVSKLKQLEPAQDYSSWSRTERIDELEFVADNLRNTRIEEIQEILRIPREDCPLIRITGLAGTGKTRFIHEALSPDDLRNRVLYVHAEKFLQSGLSTRLQINEDWSAILVVDNCSSEQHEECVRKFGGQSDRLAVITISDDFTDVEADYAFRLQPLDNEHTLELLKRENPDVAEDRLERIARFTQGFPRIAALLSENIAPHPSDSAQNLLDIDDKVLLRRLILGRGADDDTFTDHKRVLEVFSLFEKVSWQTEEGELTPEARQVAKMAGFSEDLVRFREIVATQRERGILQGDYYLSIHLLPLATYLLQSWWEAHGLEELPSNLPREMQQNFGERIPFMATFEAGREWVSSVLAVDGPLTQDDGTLLNTELGSHLVFKLAEADPENAATLLQHILSTKSVDELRSWETGRRNLVRALQYMAVWEETFDPAARLLLRLGEAENEDYSNNASGVFAGLFSPGWGKLAPTEKAPIDRLHILEETLQSDSTRRQRLGVEAAESALTEPNRIVKTPGPEFQGARPTPNLWTPDSTDELFEYYRTVWELLIENLPGLDSETRSRGIDGLTGSIRGLAKLDESMSRMIRDSIQELSQKEWIDNRGLIRPVVSLTYYDTDQLAELEGEADAWNALENQLSKSTYQRRLLRYVGLSLTADSDIYEEKLTELAEESLANPDKFEEELPWLVTDDPNQARVHEFGYALSEQDPDQELLSDVVDAFREAENRSPYFIGGYLSAVPEAREDVRQSVLDEIQETATLQALLVDVIRLSGMTTEDAERIGDALQGEIIQPEHLKGITGGPSRRVDEPVFRELCEILLYDYGNSTPAAGNSIFDKIRSIAKQIDTRLPFGIIRSSPDQLNPGPLVLLPIFHHYYVYPEDGPELPKQLSVDLLTDPIFQQHHPTSLWSNHTAYEWKEIANAVMEQYPETQDHVLEMLLDQFSSESLLGNSIQVRELLYSMLSDYPEETWDAITTALEQRDERIIVLCDWLSGTTVDQQDRPPIKLVDPSLMWEWVEQNPEIRAPIAARFVPPEMLQSNEGTCLDRELLRRYGDVDGVFGVLSDNFGTEHWTGPASQHYEEKKQQLEELREAETNDNVRAWLTEEIANLERQVQGAERFEESLGRR